MPRPELLQIAFHLAQQTPAMLFASAPTNLPPTLVYLLTIMKQVEDAQRAWEAADLETLGRTVVSLTATSMALCTDTEARYPDHPRLEDWPAEGIK